jgi:hypothetical protein
MKICYLISIHGLGGKGAGGHTYSLKATVGALSERFDCSVVQIGPRVSPVVEATSREFHYVYFNGLNMITAIRHLNSICHSQHYDLFHAFDGDGLFFARIMSAKYRKPVVLTKCGGPNPRSYFPRVRHLIVFSRENEAYFRARPKYKSSKIYFIPNRVYRVDADTEAIEEIRNMLGIEKPVFLRINRFSSAYRNVMLQSVRLIERLNNDGYACQLLLIGAVQDQDVFAEISRFQGDAIRLITAQKYTQNAARLLDVADFVIGTGRSFMEAASRGRVLLTPLEGAKYPVLVTTENFDELFATNFSPRNVLASYDEEAEYRKVVRAVKDDPYRDSLKKQADRFFDEFFSIDGAVEKYSELYHAAVYDPHAEWFDLMLHVCLCVKHYSRYALRNVRRSQ